MNLGTMTDLGRGGGTVGGAEQKTPRWGGGRIPEKGNEINTIGGTRERKQQRLIMIFQVKKMFDHV